MIKVAIVTGSRSMNQLRDGSMISRKNATMPSSNWWTLKTSTCRCWMNPCRRPWESIPRTTKQWAAKIASFDAFVFVTPEYNHGISGALKNALDYLYAEWNNKAAGFVGYGSAGGTRAVESLRLVMAELQIADVRAQVALSLRTDFENFSVFKPAPYHEKSLNGVFDQVIAWGGALTELRQN